MPTLTKFDCYGEVKDVKPVSFHFVGEKEHLAVEVQVSQNSTVEVSLKEIFEALKERKSKNVL
jgi:hypothetical protein